MIDWRLFILSDYVVEYVIVNFDNPVDQRYLTIKDGSVSFGRFNRVHKFKDRQTAIKFHLDNRMSYEMKIVTYGGAKICSASDYLFEAS